MITKLEKLRGNLVALRRKFSHGRIIIEECQRELSGIIYASDIDEQEALAKNYDNELEIIISTLRTSYQGEAALKLLDRGTQHVEELLVQP